MRNQPSWTFQSAGLLCVRILVTNSSSQQQAKEEQMAPKVPEATNFDAWTPIAMFGGHQTSRQVNIVVIARVILKKGQAA